MADEQEKAETRVRRPVLPFRQSLVRGTGIRGGHSLANVRIECLKACTQSMQTCAFAFASVATPNVSVTLRMIAVISY